MKDPIDPIHHFVPEGVFNVTDDDNLAAGTAVFRPRAVALGTYPIWTARLLTCSTVPDEIAGWPRSARETVVWDTPAAFAISFNRYTHEKSQCTRVHDYIIYFSYMSSSSMLY